ncbi:hypothetical protein [Poriferisphaera sp. WC338]|uniref:hypothetical protein n=1 Tax=Poriferisphaera sp. WC338 TaxID=3425129 RepID=UPI003D813F7B
MPIITAIYATALLCLGLVFYFTSHTQSITTLIPSFIAILFYLFAALAIRPKLRMHIMHLAVLFALVLFVYFTQEYPAAIKYLAGSEDIDRPLAAIEKSLLSLFSAAYMVFAIRSFIQARIARKKQTNSA